MGEPKSNLRIWRPLHAGLFEPQGEARGVGVAQGIGMVPQGPHISLNRKAVSPVGICCLGDVTPDRVAVPAKYCSCGQLSDGYYRGCPKRGLLTCTFWRGGGQHRHQINPRP